MRPAASPGRGAWRRPRAGPADTRGGAPGGDHLPHGRQRLGVA